MLRHGYAGQAADENTSIFIFLIPTTLLRNYFFIPVRPDGGL